MNFTLFDRFKKIDGRTIYREITEIIKFYRLRFELRKTEDDEKKKLFYLTGFDKHKNKEYHTPFITIAFGPIGGAIVPVGVKIHLHVNTLFNDAGIFCDPIEDDSATYFYSDTYRLDKWKKDKKQLVEAIEFSIKTLDDYFAKYEDWIEGRVGLEEIHFESMNPNKKLAKKEAK